MASHSSSPAPSKPSSCLTEECDELSRFVLDDDTGIITHTDNCYQNKEPSQTALVGDNNILKSNSTENSQILSDQLNRYAASGEPINCEERDTIIIDGEVCTVIPIANNGPLINLGDELFTIDNFNTMQGFSNVTNGTHKSLNTPLREEFEVANYEDTPVRDEAEPDLDEKTDEVEQEKGEDNKITRKRKRHPENWKQNVRKTKRQRSEAFVDTKGNLKPNRSVKKEMCRKPDMCSFKCSTKIVKEERENINKNFWLLTDDKKAHFYSKQVKRYLASRKRTQAEESKKIYSYQYTLNVSGVSVRVCQKFFLNTLNISKQRIYYYFKNFEDPNTNIPRPPIQGKHKKKIISSEKKDEVRAHISSFPAVESHYCRSSTNKKYLERNLNLQRMYDLYKATTEDPPKFHAYAEIFRSEYNIGFFKPKKDLCGKCEAYKFLKEPTQEQTQLYEEHMRRKKIGNEERNRDRTRFLNQENIGVVTFDLQNVFSLPKSNVGKNFYKTKLSCYNLTAHLDKNKTIYCAIWHEFTSGRAAIHIASGLIRILKRIMIDKPDLKKLVLWSDSCVPQNKNSIMSFALQNFLQSPGSNNLEVIEQKFGEPGHGNVQEIDCAHSCIEKHIRNLDIGSPLSLIRAFLSIPKNWKFTFKVIQMRPFDYLNYQLVSSTLTYINVPYTKLKHIVYKKEDLFEILYRESFEGDFKKTRLHQAGDRLKRKNRQANFPREVPPAQFKVKIPDLKRMHLTEMLSTLEDGDIAFYKGLLGLNSKTDAKGDTKKKRKIKK